MHLISAVLVLVFGAATLILHDVRFIQWKATVFYWSSRWCSRGSVWIGRRRCSNAARQGVARGHHRAAGDVARTAPGVGGVLRGARRREHLGRVQHERERLGELQGLDRRPAGLRLHRRWLTCWLLRGYQPNEGTAT